MYFIEVEVTHSVSGAPQGGSVVCVCVLSHVPLFGTPWTVAHHVPLIMGFSRQGYWSGSPCPPPGALPDPGIKPASSVAPALQTVFTSEPPGEAPIQYMCIYRFSSIYTHILFF